MADDAMVNASAMQEDESVVDLAGEDAGPQWVQYVDESGASYYANAATGETSWTLPEHAQVLLFHDPDSDHNDAKACSAAVASERLAPEVQQQVQEARRRHAGGSDALASHWVEMYDPTRDALYYYALISGEIVWTRPADGEVLRVDQDPITNTIVRIQCAIRVQLARRRVFNRKQSLANVIPHEQQVVDDTAPRVWVEVYDPEQQLLYYHCSATGETRWDPPTVFVSADESKEVAAAVSIQSMARGRQARNQVERKRIEKIERDKCRVREQAYMARPEEEREADCRRELLDQETDQIQHGDQFWGIEVNDRVVRRQLAEEAMLASAELFWQRVNAARRQLRGRSLDWRAIKLEEETRKEREMQAELTERDTMESEEQAQCLYGDGFWGIQADERREAKARREMEKEEKTSRVFSDEMNDADRCTFWAEEASTNAVLADTRRVTQEKRNQTKYMRWFYHQCSSVDDLLDYLWPTQRRFTPPPAAPASVTSTSTSVNSPTRQPGKKDKERANRSFYKLDDLVVRERLERGDLMFGHRPILTIHHPNAAQIEARRGRFEVGSVATSNVFDKAAMAAQKPINTSPYRPPPPRQEIEKNTVKAKDQREEEEEKSGDDSKTPAIHYHRSRTPDPHIPARFNGVPFMPSQMSPTRDILCGDHRKLTQLPSLPMPERTSRAKLSKPHKHPSPPRGGSSLSKAATKKMMGTGNQESPGRRRHLSIFDHDQDTVDPMATSYGFLSPFAVERRRVSQQQQQQQRLKQQPTEHREQDHDEDSRENDVHNQPDPAIVRQFEQSERGILAQVFNWMDVDGSGTVDRKEMTWALAHDHEVLTLAKQSALLRLLLKQHSELDDLFSQLDVVNGKKQGEKSVPMRPAELSWDIFVVFCREMYVRLTEQGLLPSQEASHDPENSVNDKLNASSELPQRDKAVDTSEEEEERTIRRVFQLLDADGNGLLERREICAALYESVTRDERNGDDQAGNPELASLISASRALQPLLHESLFMKAFTSFESADPDGISEEEFVAFCLEIAEVAAANHFS